MFIDTSSLGLPNVWYVTANEAASSIGLNGETVDLFTILFGLSVASGSQGGSVGSVLSSSILGFRFANLMNQISGTNSSNTINGTTADDNILAGGGNDIVDGGDGSDVINGGTGSDILNGGLGGDELVGEAGSDTLNGGADSDLLRGGDGNDILNGGAGSDDMIGGAGSDTYDVDDAGDLIYEYANDGTDTVRSSVTLTLSAHVERLILTGGSNLNGTGNDLANRLTGNAGNNSLFGLEGADRLDGGDGADIMYGGSDNDTYVVESTGDQVIEYADEGTDTVLSTKTYTLTANVERLTLEGVEAINGTGNELANRLTGNDASNILYGLGGADRLDGGLGADQMYGGTDNDTYVVESAGDQVFEFAGQGTDTVLSGISYILGAHIERLTLEGSQSLNGTGNSLANILTGNEGANRLDGGTGNDTLSGGGGNHVFVFCTGSGRDRITDFAVDVDRIDLSTLVAVTDYADLIANHMTQVGENVVIRAGNDILTINAMQLAAMDASDFMFA
jgi:Ca2+-binding RTX toxin-like protein